MFVAPERILLMNSLVRCVRIFPSAKKEAQGAKAIRADPGGWSRSREQRRLWRYDDDIHGANDDNGLVHDRQRLDAQFWLPGRAYGERRSAIHHPCAVHQH